jgi:hypothetical protein
MDVTIIETVAPTGDEKVGGNFSSFPVAPALGNVLGKHRTGRTMQGHKLSGVN